MFDFKNSAMNNHVTFSGPTSCQVTEKIQTKLKRKILNIRKFYYVLQYFNVPFISRFQCLI